MVFVKKPKGLLDEEEKKKKKKEIKPFGPEVTITSRPTGTPKSAAIDVTNLPREERLKISAASALEGQRIKGEEIDKLRKRFRIASQPDNLTEDFLNQVQQEQQQLEPTVLQQQVQQQGGLQPIKNIPQRLVSRAKELSAPVAEAGLRQINVGGEGPLVTGKLINQGIKSATGLDIGSVTSADLAQTPAGKALGLTVAGASTAALLTTVAVTIGSATAAVGASLSGSVGAATVGSVGGFVASNVLSLDSSLIVDKILNRESASEIQSAITTVGQMQTDIVGITKAGGLQPTRALAEVNQLEDNLDILEHKILQASALDPRVKQSGQLYDIRQDILDSRSQLRTARAEILTVVPEFDISQIAEITRRLEDERRKNK